MSRENSSRVEQTRAWIVQSFYELLGKRPYGDIHVNEIVGNAGVGRSTFYDHCKSKDQLLEQSLTGVLTVLADAATVGGNIDAVERTLSHFWDMRHRIRGLAFGTTEPLVSQQLAGLIEHRLDALCRERRIELAIPGRLAAAQLAGSQIGMIRAWLGDENGAASNLVARTLLQTSQANLDVLFCDSTPQV